MLTLILGRTGTGKTTELLRRLCANGAARQQVYLVPEQYSHEMERRLCQAGGAGTSLYAEVLSFTRLSSRVFAQVRGLNVPQLDNGGRLLLMHRAVRSVESLLTVYHRPSKRTAFLEGLMATSDELKSYCVQPGQLVEAAEGEADGGKLRDLGLILGAYEALAAQRAADPRDRLTRLAEALHHSDYLQNRDVYADCFVEFTPQEQRVLAEILRQAHSLTVTVTCGGWDDRFVHLEFEPARRTVAALRRLAESVGVETKIEYLDAPRQGWAPELNWLEQAYYGGKEPWDGDTEAVELYTGETPFEQVEFAAGRLLELVREKGWRWRDIGVTARTMDGWEEEIKSVFQRYGIPVSLNRMTDILQKPVLALITSALNAVSGGFEYDDMFRYLKTGLTGVDPDQRDRLENYVLQWDIRGNKWSMEAPWSWHPQGYAQPWDEAQKAQVAELDALRREIIAPLVRLKQAPGETGTERAQALYAFMEEIGLRERLEEQAHLLTERGELNQAEEYCQLWEILCGALEQCALLLGDEKLELSEFSQLFQLVLGQYEVGSIPAALDRVTVGDAPRMAHKDLKCLIVLGAEDTAFPQVSAPAGLLTDEDRELLSGLGLSLSPSAEERSERELTILYELISLPRELLVVCRSEHSAAGEEQRPSVLVTRLEELFPRCVRVRSGQRRQKYRLSAPVPALEYLAETRSPAVMAALKALPQTAARAERLERSFSTERGRLSPQAVERLYSRTIRLSASKMDKLKGCHFSYFLQYGLNARPRRRASFDAPTAGSFVHYVLQHLLQAAQTRGGVKSCDDETLKSLTRQIVARYIREELGGLDDKPKRFRYLFRRLLRSIDQVVANVVEELRSSDFEPLYFELGFGRGNDVPVEVHEGSLTLSITGFVDRVDGWYHDGRLYYRVVDYKTGYKSFDFTDIWNGLGMQMLIYLFALQEKGDLILDQHDPIPAGVLYLPARDVIVSGERDLDEAQRQQAVDKNLTRSGLLLNDLDVLEAMEHAGENGIRFLPVRVSKGGKLSGDSLASMEQMGKLKRHIERILSDIGREFASGDVDADPYYHGQRTACNYCEFAAACHFEEGQKGSFRRYIPTVKAKEFWEKLSEESNP